MVLISLVNYQLIPNFNRSFYLLTYFTMFGDLD